MALKEKYQELITAARAYGVTKLRVEEHRGVLFIEGMAPSNDVKQKLWNLYGKLSNYESTDLILKLSVDGEQTQE